MDLVTFADEFLNGKILECMKMFEKLYLNTWKKRSKDLEEDITFDNIQRCLTCRYWFSGGMWNF